MVSRVWKKRILLPNRLRACIQSWQAWSQAPCSANAIRLRVKQYVRQSLLAVSEVVFDMVALVLEQIEGFVLDLPAGASAPHQFLDIVSIGLQ